MKSLDERLEEIDLFLAGYFLVEQKPILRSRYDELRKENEYLENALAQTVQKYEPYQEHNPE